ncbi:MAG: hypothetical protein FJ290_13920 [Planctomycetes bacterium]|nr:hypothetical protein [Planctomycetota bacterium]
MRSFALTCIVVALLAPVAQAKAHFAGKREMIETAEAIAIVNIEKVEPVKRKGRDWTYSQRATGTVERSLKGDLKGEIEIYGDIDFICANCRYQTGRFLLFLRRDAGLWTGSNWHLGIRRIKDGKVQWFKDDRADFDSDYKAVFEHQELPLDGVVKEIGRILKEQRR